MNPKPSVEYSIWIDDHGNQMLGVSAVVHNPKPKDTLYFAEWIMGSYHQMEYERDVCDLAITHNGQEFSYSYDPKEIGQIHYDLGENYDVNSPLTVELNLSATREDVDGSFIHRDFAAINPVGLPFWKDRDNEPGTLTIFCPEGDFYNNWRVNAPAQLTPIEIDAQGFGLYAVKRIIDIADCPFTMGKTAEGSFDAKGAYHKIAILGQPDSLVFDMDRLAADMEKICEVIIEMFEEKASYKRYLFLLVTTTDQGGLEHLHSSLNYMNWGALPITDENGKVKNWQQYLRLLGLLAHEFTHRYNVKSLRYYNTTTEALQAPLRSDDLWFYEGATEYIAEMALIRAGIIGVPTFLAGCSQVVTRELRNPGAFHRSLSEASECTWTIFQDYINNKEPNAMDMSQNYYVGGQLRAMALDIYIRALTHGKKTFGDGMRLLYETYAKNDQPIPEDGIEKAFSEVAGRDLTPWFENAVKSRKPMDLRSYFAGVGIEMVVRQQQTITDVGGSQERIYVDSKKGWLGATFRGNTVYNTREGSAAAEALIFPEDVILAIAGQEVDKKEDLFKIFGAFTRGQTVAIKLLSKGREIETEVVMQEAPTDTCDLFLDEDALQEAVVLRNQWLTY